MKKAGIFRLQESKLKKKRNEKISFNNFLRDVPYRNPISSITYKTRILCNFYLIFLNYYLVALNQVVGYLFIYKMFIGNFFFFFERKICSIFG